MITAVAFLAIEASLTKRLVKDLSLATKEVYSKVSEALASGNTDLAMQEFNRLSLAKVFEKNKPYILYVTNMAMLFGASRVTQQPGTSVVGMGFEKMSAIQLANAFEQMILQKGETYLKTEGAKYIMPPAVVEKAERILQPFQSFMDSTGKAFIQLASSLHTSRVSAYGFTAEAMVLGMDEYQITEQLDKRTCPVCRLMHGKKFKVKDARALLDVVTRSVDPDDLKQLQPWPSQTKAAVEAMAKLEPRELVANGWHIPPFHPLCRGLLTRVGKAPNLDDVKAGTYQEKYEATREDFKALQVSCNPTQLKLWNSNVGLAPGEVVARLTGRPIDEFFSGLLDAKKPKEYAGIYSFSMAKDITIQLTKPGFGSKNPFDQGVMIKPESKSLYLDALDLVEADQGAGVAKRYMREFYTLAKDMELEKMELVAGLDMGGYAWAKYGFYPTKTSWDALKGDLATRYAQVKTELNLTPLEEAEYLAIMASPDPKTIFTLSDAHFGKELLLGQLWEGSLPFGDKESVTRFLSYIGELK